MIDKEKQQKQRERVQNKAVELSLEHKHLLLVWATGVGKGRALMKCIDKSTSRLKWLIMCPEIAQVENFKRDLEKHGYGHLMDSKIENVICYASFKNHQGTKLNLALNECHRLSELRENIAQTVSFDQIISDSATVPTEVRNRLWQTHPYFEYEITMDAAIQMGILPEPRITLYGVEIDDAQRRIEMVGRNKKIQLVTEREFLNKIDEDLSYWLERSSHEPWAATKVKSLGSQRKRFLTSCKTRAARDLINNMEDMKYVCFTGSVDQAVELGGKYAVHSRKSAKTNEEIIRKFNEGTYNKIFANRMMREGMNLDNIEAGIIIQLDSGQDEGLNFIQMCGRTMRAEAPEIFILYVRNTQDEKYLRRALSKIDKRYIKEHINV